MAISFSLTAAHELQLIALGQDVGRSPTLHDACALIVDRVASALGTSCLIRSQNDTEWHTIARAGDAALFEDNARTAIAIPLEHTETPTELVIVRPVDSTAQRGAPPSSSKRLLDDPAWKDAVGRVITTALQLVEMKAQRSEAERRAGSIERFSRALLAISDSATLHRSIVESMARAVDAEIGALAVFVPQDNCLAITATHGYPAVLVEHVRITPGEGVLGRVFLTAEPVVVSKVNSIQGQSTRRRYRTDSYAAFPLIGPDGVVAVVSLTDKSGSAAFTKTDVEVLSQMSIPAALALIREQLRDRTNDLAHLATVDALTGLFNRRYFETRVEQELQRQRRQFEELSLLLLDLDNFKELNDTQGHPVGDIALKEVAEILRRAVRIFDVCARYGGEEFVILMPGAGASTALRIAERIRRQVEQHFATGLRSGVPVSLTVSIGVSTATPGVTRDALVTDADTALLQSKALGKNQVHLHGGE